VKVFDPQSTGHHNKGNPAYRSYEVLAPRSVVRAAIEGADRCWLVALASSRARSDTRSDRRIWSQTGEAGQENRVLLQKFKLLTDSSRHGGPAWRALSMNRLPIIL